MVTYDARPSGFTQLTSTSDWESFMSSAGIWDGIDGSNSFVPSLDTSGRNAVISAGQCLIKGQLWRADAPVSTPIPAASSQNRIDRLVLRLSRTASTSATVIAPVVITGTPAASPAPPPLTQTATGIFDISVSQWTSNSSGTLTGLADQRRYSGRTVVSMTSGYHPTPPNPCLGVEIDTGNVYVWNGSSWASIWTDAGVVQSGNTVSAAGYFAAFTPFAIPANDTINSPISYRIKCGGHGTQATGAAVNIQFQVAIFGNALGANSDNGGIAAGGAFHWSFDGEVIVSNNGAASFHGTMSIGSHSTAMDQQMSPGTFNTAAATNITLQIGWASITGAPTLVCTGATFERLSN
jgi:hypothetical protein